MTKKFTASKVVVTMEVDLSVIKLEREVIRTLTDYPQTYRFRLWVAMVEDMELLGMGHRAYHSHIFESFRAWETQKVIFQNAKGRELVIDTLSKDDIYGFLGKREEAPLGPKRSIETAKFAVIDAFFRKKYPKLASSFETNTPVSELTSILQGFFAKEQGLDISPNERANILRSLDGVYIPKIFHSISDLRRAKSAGEVIERIIPVFLINSTSRKGHCVVHKVEFPLLSRYMRVDTSEFKTMSRLESWIDRHAPPSTVIYSGFGIITPSDSIVHSPTLACILRDRTIYRPCLTTLRVDRIHNGSFDDTDWVTHGAFETSAQDVLRYYIFCKDANNYAIIKKNFGYSADFLNDIFEMKNTLGSEV